jgi:hypothetical protein
MKKFFDSILSYAIKTISDSTDSELFSDQFEELTFNQYKIESPKLDKENIKIDIAQEIIGFHNAPEGMSFTPGHPMEYALFSVPVLGSGNIFKLITGPLYSDRKIAFDGEYLYYKEFSTQRITGNDPVILNIKENARLKISFIESKLDSFITDVDSFHENSLRPTIKQTIENERKKRERKSDSIKKMNPFS